MFDPTTGSAPDVPAPPLAPKNAVLPMAELVEAPALPLPGTVAAVTDGAGHADAAAAAIGRDVGTGCCRRRWCRWPRRTATARRADGDRYRGRDVCRRNRAHARDTAGTAATATGARRCHRGASTTAAAAAGNEHHDVLRQAVLRPGPRPGEHRRQARLPRASQGRPAPRQHRPAVPGPSFSVATPLIVSAPRCRRG